MLMEKPITFTPLLPAMGERTLAATLLGKVLLRAFCAGKSRRHGQAARMGVGAMAEMRAARGM